MDDVMSWVCQQKHISPKRSTGVQGKPSLASEASGIPQRVLNNARRWRYLHVCACRWRFSSSDVRGWRSPCGNTHRQSHQHSTDRHTSAGRCIPGRPFKAGPCEGRHTPQGACCLCQELEGRLGRREEENVEDIRRVWSLRGGVPSWVCPVGHRHDPQRRAVSVLHNLSNLFTLADRWLDF